MVSQNNSSSYKGHQGRLYLHLNGEGNPLDAYMRDLFMHLAKNNVLRSGTISRNPTINQNIILDQTDVINVINYLIANIFKHSIPASEIVVTFWRIRSLWKIAKTHWNKFSEPENQFLSMLLYKITGTDSGERIDRIVDIYIPLIEKLHLTAGIDISPNNIDEVVVIEGANAIDTTIINLLAS